jgi:hypothetical protein
VTRRDVVPLAGAVLIGVAAVTLAATGAAGSTDAARVGGCAVAVVALCWFVTRLGTGSRHSGFDASVRPVAAPSADRPEDLEQLERAVQLHATAGDLHVRLRPALREIAAQRLRTTRGLDIDRDRTAVDAVLGEQLAELVRADRPVPRDVWAPSMRSLDDVTGYIESLEAL